MELDSNFILKLISIPSLFLLCFIFGIMPFAIEKCRMNEAFLSFANTFSGGLFFGIGQFHLLNEGVEKLKKYTSVPWPYFLAAIGFSVILFIQKAIFGNIVPSAEESLQNHALTTSAINKEKLGGLLNENNMNDEGKQTIINNEELKEHNDHNINVFSGSNDSLPKVDYDLSDEEIGQNTASIIFKTEEELNSKKRKLSAFILLLSLSIHGLFECLALGIQTNYRETLFLFIALMIHKWAEAFALGVLFVKAKFTKKFYYLIVTLFAIIGPIGVTIGIVLSATAGELVEGIFLSFSTGTFLYVSCSEIITEEFSTPQKRYLKFFLYFFGCVFAAGLSLLEYVM